MNRADLSWALKAVLPHVGRYPCPTTTVGIEFRDGYSYVYATDKLTMAVARVNDELPLDVHLPGKEATDLMRFIRPARVGERDQEVVYALRPQELHVGYGEERDGDSAVFETTDAVIDLDVILSLIAEIAGRETELDECIYQPGLLARFSQAERDADDRLRIFHRHTSDKYGAAVVTVGRDFIGAIAAMTYDFEGPATVAGFLGKREAA